MLRSLVGSEMCIRDRFNTSTYIKPTDKGVHLNYNSYSPEKYKISLIKTLIHRAHKVTSTWNAFHAKITRINKNLINNDFPESIVDKTIKKTINHLFIQTNETNKEDKITFYFETQNQTKIKEETKSLKAILKQHLKPLKQNNEIDIQLYYKSQKLSSKFSTRPTTTGKDHVVYQFNCPEDNCTSCLLYTSDAADE